MDYLTIKWIHVFSSTFLFGTGVGSAFYMFFANLSRDERAIAVVTRRVVLADWVFTMPTAIIQPVTGLYLAWVAGFPLHAAWLSWSIGLYVLAAACWIPVVAIQIRMAKLAKVAVAHGQRLPAQYWRYHALWTALGVPAFVAFAVIFYLMVVKPT